MLFIGEELTKATEELLMWRQGAVWTDVVSLEFFERSKPASCKNLFTVNPNVKCRNTLHTLLTNENIRHAAKRMRLLFISIFDEVKKTSVSVKDEHVYLNC